MKPIKEICDLLNIKKEQLQEWLTQVVDQKKREQFNAMFESKRIEELETLLGNCRKGKRSNDRSKTKEEKTTKNT